MFPSFRVSLSALFFLVCTTAQNVLYEMESAEATVYYDLTNTLCDYSEGGPNAPNWGVVSGINFGIPTCEGSNTKTLAELGTNRVVAMDGTKLQADMEKWCGKEVVVYDPSGKQITIDEGPFFIWDACAACSGAAHIDMSAKGFVQVKGGTCAGNNPQGLKVQILDNNIWQPVSGSSGSTAGNTSASTLSAAVGGNSIAAAVVQPPAALVSSNSPAIAASSAPAPTTPATPPTAPAAPSGNAGNIKAAVVGSPAKISSVSDNIAVAAAPGTSTSTSTALITTTVDPTPSSPPIPATSPVDTAAAPASSAGPATLPPAPYSAAASGAAPPASSPTDETAPASSPLPAAPSASGTAATCKLGAWQCSGLALQVCNYLTTTSLGWETIENCKSKCAVTGSGSIDCE